MLNSFGDFGYRLWKDRSLTVAAPETIQQNFPTLSLDQIHGAIAFYLGHREQVEAYLRKLEKKWDELEGAAKPANPEIQHRIEEARKRLLAR